MPIEAFGNIDDLDPLNPLVDDPVSEGDDHLRGIKESLQGNVAGDATFTALLVAGVARAILDAVSLDVLAARLDLDNSGADEITQAIVRNLIGGIAMRVDDVTGSMRLDQVSAAGGFEKLLMIAERDGAVTLLHPETAANAVRSADRAVANSSAEVFDSAGQAKPIGFNTMVQIATPGTFTVSDTENGTRQRTGNVGITITLPNSPLVAGWTMILQKGTVTGTAFDTITTPGTLRWYRGDAILTGTRQLQQSGVCTITQNSTGFYDIWGTGLS